MSSPFVFNKKVDMCLAENTTVMRLLFFNVPLVKVTVGGKR